jgi:hypothetical protein
MRNAFVIVALFFCLPLVKGQTAEENVLPLKQQAEGVVLEAPREEVQTGEKKKPGHWNFSVGTSYSYMKGYGSGMMLYTAPTYTLTLSDRWSLHGGLIASHYQGLNYSQYGENLLPGSFSSLSVFAAASYRASDRLVLHGTGIKQLVQAPVSPFTPYPMDDFSLGATYKIGDNMTIGASVHMRNGNSYYSAPFMNPMFPSNPGW